MIGLVVVAVSVAAYWCFYRPLPRTSGTIAAPLQAKATVVRDNLGVPHVMAETDEDGFFLQGFVTAQDRFFQMDMSRRRGAGELAEILGPRALNSDRQARRMRLWRIARRYAESLEPENRAAFAAYARGVNFYLETHRSRMPVEFRILGYDPRPWRIADSIVVALQFFETLSSTWRDEIRKQKLFAGGDSDRVRALFPLWSPVEIQPGSNAWVLSGDRTVSGKPLLASDPHLPFTVPCFWHEVHLRTRDSDVTGVAIPGLPGVIIGHNRRIAWGATNLLFDVQDLYMERLDPRTGVYTFRGRRLQAVREMESIPVRGRTPEQLSKWVTHHGPIIVSSSELHLALRWTAAGLNSFPYPFLAINRAENWQQFRKALSGYGGPAQNFVYADVDGNIGYQAAGKLPRRGNYDGDVPVDGSSGMFEWDGFIPFDELPMQYNPSSGMIVSANQNPFPRNYPYRVSGSFAAGYRAHRIQQLLSSRERWRADELLGVQTDIYSSFEHFLAGQLVAAWDRRGRNDTGLSRAVDLFRKWDGRMDAHAAAPFLARLLFQHIRTAIAERASPGGGILYGDGMAPAVIEWLLRNRPKNWFENYDQLLLRSFVDAVDEARRIQGDDPDHWIYGRYNTLSFHGVWGAVPIIGRYLELNSFPLSGSPTTVKQTSPALGPSMRMVVDLADWESSLLNLTLGESGHRFSSHFDDQWKSYRAGKSFPLSFQRVGGGARLEFLTER